MLAKSYVGQLPTSAPAHLLSLQVETTVFHSACFGGSEEVCQWILSNRRLGNLINVKNGEDWTPLHYAASRGHLALCKYLISCGAFESIFVPNQHNNFPENVARLAAVKEYLKNVRVSPPWLVRVRHDIIAHSHHSMSCGPLVNGTTSVHDRTTGLKLSCCVLSGERGVIFIYRSSPSDRLWQSPLPRPLAVVLAPLALRYMSHLDRDVDYGHYPDEFVRPRQSNLRVRPQRSDGHALPPMLLLLLKVLLLWWKIQRKSHPQ